MSARIAWRFVLTGLANTAVGLLAVCVCQWFGWSPYVANGVGYAAGLAFGFVMNRAWTFADRRNVAITAPRYLIAFGISYGANLAVLTGGLRLLSVPATVAQAAALSTYSVMFYLLCRYFVFEPDAS